jgi:hypothetical protein
VSAYRAKPPPPRWVVLYERSRAQHIGRTLTLWGFSAITVGALALAVGGAVLDWPAGLALVPLGLCLAVTSAAFLGIVWATRLPLGVELTVEAVSAYGGGERRCRIQGGGETLTLPVDARSVHVGQTLRILFREIAPQDDGEAGRDILLVRARQD